MSDQAVYQTFESLTGNDERESTNSDYVPFALRKDTSEEGTLKWLNENFDHCFDSSKDRLRAYESLAKRYRGNKQSGKLKESHRDVDATTAKVKIHNNFFYDYTEKKVSQLAQNPVNLIFIPQDDTTQDDINDAKACELLVRHRMNQLGFDNFNSEVDRMMFKYGHVFTKVYWDKTQGPISKKVLDAKEKYGDKINVSVVQARLGDVCHKIIPAGQLFPERRKLKWKEVDYVDEIEFINKYILEKEHEGKNLKKENYNWPSIDSGDWNSLDNICVHHFYHRPTVFLPNGIYIKYTEHCILEIVEDPARLRKMMPDFELPYVPDTDIDVDDDFWARSYFTNIEQRNNVYDLIDQGVVRNIGVASHPKLMIPEGSVEIKQMNNDYSTVQYRGAVQPNWLQHNYINRGEFEIQDRLERKMDSLAKVSELTKNPSTFKDMPASAIRMLEDQASGVNTSTINKRKERTRIIYWKTALMMGENYQDDDGRIVSVVGEDNEYIIKSFKKIPSFRKLSSIQTEYTSALSTSRAGKVADIVDLNQANQKDPAFGRKEIISILGLGVDKAFKEEIAFGVVTGRTILEKLKEGEMPPPPARTDDLITIYMILSRYTESVPYKMKISETVRSNINNYILGLEGLMAEQAQQNALFAMKVREIDKYPIFFDPGAEIVKAPAVEQPAPNNQANVLQNLQQRNMNQP